ncbi:MAG: bifunctional glycosyltransferase/CDP-glycerol:glycerophosphate glycerophosphotransferase [Coriobacteriales bacterium]
MKPKVSVLTPVYNVEEYLGECLDSLINQTLEDIEFICVNDGSTDNSPSILNEYASKDPRFIIVNQENGGYGKAMNNALAHATGEYIGILESDDFAEPETFEILYNAAIKNDCDFAKGNYFQHNTQLGSFEYENYRENECGKVFCPNDPDKLQLIRTPAIWNAVYRRSFLQENNIDFLESPGAAFQDTGFVYKVWIAAKRAILVHNYLIHYRVNREGSSVNSDDKVYNVCDEWASIFEFLDKYPQVKEKSLGRILALKYGTYNWNYHRIKKARRKEFLERMADEYRGPAERGELAESYFPKSQWTRLHAIIDNPKAVYQQDCDAEFFKRPLRLSVIVPVHNAEAYLDKLIKSLSAQKLPDMEVLFVDDGSTDKSPTMLDKACKRRRGWKVYHQPNRGVGAARNLGLFRAKGKYLVFCDADDIIPAKAYEKLYRAIEVNSADMAVGRMREFSVSGSAIYPPTRRQSKKDRIDKFDKDFAISLSLCNKIFRRDIVDREGLAFSSELIGEDAIFLSQYMAFANNIVGCNATVYYYRKAEFFEQRSATSTITTDAIISFLRSHKQVQQNADNAISKDKATCDYGSADKLFFEKLQIIFHESMEKRLVTLPLDRYYRHIWIMDNASFEYLESSYKTGLQKLSTKDKQDILQGSYYADLRLAENHLLSKEELAESPLISLIISPHMKQDTFKRTLQSLYLQEFPAFELFIPEKAQNWAIEDRLLAPNVHFYNDKQSLASVIEETHSPYINILEDQIFHSRRSLDSMWKAATTSRADFITFNFASTNLEAEKKRLRCIREVFRSDICTPSKRSPINEFDRSPNNKVFKKEALLRSTIPLEQETRALIQSCYKTMSFEKKRKREMISLEKSAFFMNDVSIAAKFALGAGEVKHRREEQAKRKEKEETSFANSPKVIRAQKRPLRNEVVFYTSRNKGNLSAGMRRVYNALDCHKQVYAAPLPHSDDYKIEVAQRLARAKVIVTDDYCHYISNIKLKDNQTFIQLWHACGAFKKFGLDYGGALASSELEKHKQYSLVSVSSEFVRPIYAKAFGIPKKKVKAWGVPRTDLLLDKSFMSEKKAALLSAHPELAGKRIVLYAPTFRQVAGHQVVWDSKIDWRALSEQLPKNTVIIVKKHPLETTVLVTHKQENVIELDGLDDIETVAVADGLITDYSSIVFDFALVEKPYIFYCPDLTKYETGFYLRFPEDSGNRVYTDSSKLPQAIEDMLNSPLKDHDAVFREKFMGACDGHSTERIVSYIQEQLS